MTTTMPSTNKLQKKRVLLVGASTGFGFAIAKAALEHGAEVIICSSKQAKIDKAVLSLQEHMRNVNVSAPNVRGATCDLGNLETMEANIKNLFAFATDNGKHLVDHVVYTAGDFFKPPALDIVTPQDMLQVGRVRVHGVIMLAKHLPIYINQSTNSSFTLTGSTTYKQPKAGWTVVNGIGGGVEPMTRALAIDLKPVRVNCVMAGYVPTELFDGFPKEVASQMFKTMSRESIVDRVGTPGEMAEAYLYLMKCTFATGSTVMVDGGREIAGFIKSL